MKTTHFSGRKLLTGLTALLFTSVSIMSCEDDNNNTPNNSPYSINGNGSGTQVVPANAGTGTSTITGTYYPDTRQLIYTSNWSGLTGAPTTGGFYTGASGAAGTLNGTAWTFDSTATGTGSRTDTIALTSNEATDLLGGNWYYSYGTTAYPGGEVRGQITATR